MTKLIPPKAWVADLRKRKRPPGPVSLVGWVTESELAEVQRNATQHALEAAAKAVCGDCKMGAPPIEVAGVLWHRGIVWCKANPIRLLMSVNPAPAGNETKGVMPDAKNG